MANLPARVVMGNWQGARFFSMDNQPIPQGQTGVVLVFVLLMMVLLSVMAASFSSSMRGGASLMHNKKSQLRAEELVNTGVLYASYMMTQPVEEARWYARDADYQIKFEGELIGIRIHDEVGKFNINLLDKKILLGLLISAGAEPLQAEQLADCILDWRDVDDLVREHGAERQLENDSQILDASIEVEYIPANRPFNHLRELLHVKGMTDSFYRKIRPLLTVQPIKKLDLGVATEPVLNVFSELFDVGDVWVQQVLSDRLVKRAGVFVSEAMRKYANIKTPSRGYWIEMSIKVNSLNGKPSVTNVLMRRNEDSLLPLFLEVDRYHISG
ncbi:MAG: hypothetical protein AB1Y26_07420 [Cycloclasticus sp.]